MNDDELTTAVKASVTDVRMTIPAEQIISRSRTIRTRRRVPALATALAVTAAVAVAVTSLIPGTRAGGAGSAAPPLRARLLAAIDAARGDILMTYGPPDPRSGYGLVYPWYPRPGQQVRILYTGLGRAADQGQVVALPADAAGLRRQLASGQFKIIRRTVVDGRKAIELAMTGLNPG
jgi:hypothetical protein